MAAGMAAQKDEAAGKKPREQEKDGKRTGSNTEKDQSGRTPNSVLEGRWEWNKQKRKGRASGIASSTKRKPG